MALETVGHVVAAIVDSYAVALECYAGWRWTQGARNHYHYRATRSTSNNDGDRNDSNNTDTTRKSEKGTAFSAAGASLSLSKTKIEEAFNSGADVLGDEFISGDAACYDVLIRNLALLRDCVTALKGAVEAGEYYPLPLAEVTRLSEAMRISTLAALREQYQRLVVGRLAPRVAISSPKLSRVSDESQVDEGVSRGIDVDAVARTRPQDHYQTNSANSCSQTTDSNSNNNHHDPPSPPTTPVQVLKEPPPTHDSESTYSWSTTGLNDNRPKNSVFSVFCPEAMKYQVDLDKALPVEGARCRCGYVWDADHHVGNKTVMVIKDGFHITPRFLGKSHCDNGLGCVLCTSSGKTETFASVEGLKTHINSSHTKWQLLHDRDLAGR
ncbi:hypothetical protein F5Y08DRAFT_343329 [Xylaria arbuscula]|nr:hypothetical protein F5Y08DRAFT_343329 [Xylaria arbuscula]